MAAIVDLTEELILKCKKDPVRRNFTLDRGKGLDGRSRDGGIVRYRVCRWKVERIKDPDFCLQSKQERKDL